MLEGGPVLDILVLIEGTDKPGRFLRVGIDWQWSRYTRPGEALTYVKTDQHGRAQFSGLPQGQVGLAVWVDGQPLPEDDIDQLGIWGDGSETTLSVQLTAKAGLTASGTILRPDGSPAAGHLVELSPGGGPAIRATTGSLGRFQFRGLIPVRYKLVSRPPAGDDSSLGHGALVPSIEGLVITEFSTEGLPGKGLSFRVRDARGHDIKNFRWRVVGRDDVWTSERDGAFRDAQGIVSVPHAIGPAYVEIWDSRSTDGLPLISTNARAGPLAGSALHVVTLGWAHMMEGSVTDTTVVGAEILIAPLWASAWWPVEAERLGLVVTDQEGKFRCEHLVPGHYRLFVRVADGWADPVPQVIPEGTGHISIQVSRAPPVTLRVTGASNDPLEGVEVRVYDRLSPVVGAVNPRLILTTKTGANADVQLEGLDPALTYLLILNGASLAARMSGIRSLEYYLDDTWIPRDQTIALRLAGRVFGKVLTATGDVPHESVSVACQFETPGGFTRAVRLFYPTEFSFIELPLGPVTLRVRYLDQVHAHPRWGPPVTTIVTPRKQGESVYHEPKGAGLVLRLPTARAARPVKPPNKK